MLSFATITTNASFPTCSHYAVHSPEQHSQTNATAVNPSFSFSCRYLQTFVVRLCVWEWVCLLFSFHFFCCSLRFVLWNQLATHGNTQSLFEIHFEHLLKRSNPICEWEGDCGVYYMCLLSCEQIVFNVQHIQNGLHIVLCNSEWIRYVFASYSREIWWMLDVNFIFRIRICFWTTLPNWDNRKWKMEEETEKEEEEGMECVHSRKLIYFGLIPIRWIIQWHCTYPNHHITIGNSSAAATAESHLRNKTTNF